MSDNTFYPYTPAYVDLSHPPQPVDFTSFDDLLTCDTLKRHSSLPNFVRFEYSPDEQLLLSVHDGGYEWWVAGSFKNPMPNLPIWEPKYRTE